jgi:hypothetical protein
MKPLLLIGADLAQAMSLSPEAKREPFPVKTSLILGAMKDETSRSRVQEVLEFYDDDLELPELVSVIVDLTTPEGMIAVIDRDSLVVN